MLKPGGILRIAIPVLGKVLHAYLAGDSAYSYVPDSDARTIGAKLITQLTWYGSVRKPFHLGFPAGAGRLCRFPEHQPLSQRGKKKIGIGGRKSTLINRPSYYG